MAIEIGTRIHDKTGEQLHTVKLGEKVSRDTFVTLRSNAKAFEGYYSRFIHRFVFKHAEDAQSFAVAAERRIHQDATTTTFSTAPRLVKATQDEGHAPNLDLLLGM